MSINKILMTSAAALLSLSAYAQAEDDPAISFMNDMNLELEYQGEDYRLYKMELLGSGDGVNMGRTVIAKNVGNKQLGSDWVPGDPRSLGGTEGLVYAIDGVETTVDISYNDQLDRVRTGFEDWDELKCSDIGIEEVFGGPLGNIGFVGALIGDIDAPFFGADMVHAGFKSPAFFSAIGASPTGTIGVNFTFVWTDANGATDIDNNNRSDVALKESYYNDGFTYADDEDPASGIDFATVALHESGHALSRAHFGDVSIHKGKLKTSPDAIMNAIYAGPRRKILGPDKGGHCSDWAQWPQN